jgi:hypothetical protein
MMMMIIIIIIILDIILLAKIYTVTRPSITANNPSEILDSTKEDLSVAACGSSGGEK